MAQDLKKSWNKEENIFSHQLPSEICPNPTSLGGRIFFGILRADLALFGSPFGIFPPLAPGNTESNHHEFKRIPPRTPEQRQDGWKKKPKDDGVKAEIFPVVAVKLEHMTIPVKREPISISISILYKVQTLYLWYSVSQVPTNNITKSGTSWKSRQLGQ
jgi:hypothetical protein